MAIAIKSSIKREISVKGVEEPITLTITSSGVEMAVSGQKLKLRASWEDVVTRAARTPFNVPCFLDGKPLELLRYQAKKRRKKRESAGDNAP